MGTVKMTSKDDTKIVADVIQAVNASSPAGGYGAIEHETTTPRHQLRQILPLPVHYLYMSKACVAIGMERRSEAQAGYGGSLV